MASTVDKPVGRLKAIQNALTPKEWTKIAGMAAVVVGLNVAGWAMLLTATGHHYHLSKRASSASGPGCSPTRSECARLDADHISAIDNTTRKLMAEGSGR